MSQIKSLRDRVLDDNGARDSRKHELAEDGDHEAYAEREINAMSNAQFLSALSTALDEIINEVTEL